MKIFICGPMIPRGRTRSRSLPLLVNWILTEYINRSKETTIDQTLGCCQLSEIVRGFINDMAEAMNYMWLGCCLSERKKLGAGLHAENHNQIIGPDSSPVYQAVTKGNYCLKIAKRRSHMTTSGV